MVCIFCVDSRMDSAGIKWSEKAFLKTAQVPKSTPPAAAKAVFCRSRAHSAALVPALKYVRVVIIFLCSVSKILVFKR